MNGKNSDPIGWMNIHQLNNPKNDGVIIKKKDDEGFFTVPVYLHPHKAAGEAASPYGWLLDWATGPFGFTTAPGVAADHREYHNCKVIPLYAAPPQQPERVDLSFMSLRGDDKRVNVDSYKEAIEAARSNIGARRPDDDEPEDQWYWDKLTSLLALINQQESKP